MIVPAHKYKYALNKHVNQKIIISHYIKIYTCNDITSQDGYQNVCLIYCTCIFLLNKLNIIISQLEYA